VRIVEADDVRPGEGAAPIRAWLECDLDAEPIEGTLSQPEGPQSRFVGWLGLTAALERLRAGRKDVKEKGEG
jgi:hypothetical protein